MSFNDRIRKLCRICGDVGSIHIFGSMGQSLDLSEKINTLLPIHTTLSDRLSTVICEACVGQIITMSQIVEKGIHTNELMIKLLKMKDDTFQKRMLQLCRICGDPGMMDIFGQYDENYVCLADKINSFLLLQVSPTDKLSMKICHNCSNQIKDVYPIFEFCHNTTNLMLMIIGDMTKDIIKTETDPIEITSEITEAFQENISLGNSELNIEDINNKENKFGNNFNREKNDEKNILISKDNFINSNQTQCLRCTNIFTSGTDLRHHILLNHNLKELDCHHCFRRCSNLLEFESHVKLHFLPECPYYKCDLCLMCFNSLGNLVRHIKTHDLPRIVEWALAYNLPNSSISFNCRYCSKIYTRETSRRMHERSHFACLICETCGKLLPNKSQLNVHQRQHTGERPYGCINCGSSFKCLSTLRQHEVVHSEKKYSCEVCLRKFSRPEKVRIHMRVHTGEKPYNCSMCHKKYQQKNDLNRHLKKKHETLNQINMNNFR